MAGAHLTVTIQPGAAVSRLEALDAALANPGGLLARVGEHLRVTTRARFQSQAGPDGRAWRPLAPSYQKSKKYNKNKILTLRGHLRGSIRWQPDGPDAVQVGTNLSYAAIHQFGGTIQQHAQSRRQRFTRSGTRNLFAKRGARGGVTERRVTRPAHVVHIVARPFLGLSQADRTHLQQLLHDWLADPSK